MPRASATTHAFASIEALQRALVHPQFEVVQVRPGRFETTLLRAEPRPDLALTLGSNAASVRSRGQLDAAFTDVVVVIEAPGPAYFNGIPLRPGLVLVMPPGIEFEGHSPAGFTWANLHLRAEVLLAATCSLAGRGFELPTRSLLARLTLPADAARLRALHAAGCDAAGPSGAAADASVAEPLSETWLGIVARALAGARRGDPSAGVRPDDRHRVFLVAEDYLRRRVAQPVYMAELCGATGVSERTLEYAFRERLGVTPTAYLASLRLNLARIALIEAAADPRVSVASIARRFGFSHLGRFAARYRAHFGEPPSATRRRSPPGPPGGERSPSVVAP